jgi:hypothetical protein
MVQPGLEDSRKAVGYHYMTGTRVSVLPIAEEVTPQGTNGCTTPERESFLGRLVTMVEGLTIL